MENMIFFILIVLTLINIKIKGSNQFFDDYMDLKYTQPIKGIFVWFIIIRHYLSYYKANNNYLYRQIIKHFGQKIVSLFLFYSSFGIYESIKKKGSYYARSLLKKSFIIFIKSQIIIFLYAVSNLLLGIKFRIKDYFLSVIFYKGIGNSYWFAFTIIVFYLYSFISFAFIKSKHCYFFGIFIINIICLIHMYFIHNYYFPKVNYPVDNTFCFIIGFYYSLLKNYIDNILLKNDIFYFTFMFFFILVYYYFYTCHIRNVFIFSMVNMLFCLIAIFISMKIRFNNEFLTELSSHSYSIYLLQRLVMRYVFFKKGFQNNEIIRFFFEFITILLFAIIFDKYTAFIDKYFKRQISKKELFEFKKYKIEKNKIQEDIDEALKRNQETIKLLTKTNII